MIKQPKKQNKAGGKMIGKKFIKEGGKYRRRGKQKRGLRSPLPSMVKLNCLQLKPESKLTKFNVNLV